MTSIANIPDGLEDAVFTVLDWTTPSFGDDCELLYDHRANQRVVETFSRWMTATCRRERMLVLYETEPMDYFNLIRLVINSKGMPGVETLETELDNQLFDLLPMEDKVAYAAFVDARHSGMTATLDKKAMDLALTRSMAKNRKAKLRAKIRAKLPRKIV